jgi:hypothetical protein
VRLKRSPVSHECYAVAAAEVQGFHLARSSVPVQAPRFTRNIGCNVRGCSARVEWALIDGRQRKLSVHNLLQVGDVVVGNADRTRSAGVEYGHLKQFIICNTFPVANSSNMVTMAFHVLRRHCVSLYLVECNKKVMREERRCTECCCCCTPRRCFGRLMRPQGEQRASAQAGRQRSRGTGHAATAHAPRGVKRIRV